MLGLRTDVEIRQPYGEAIKGTAELVMRVSANRGKHSLEYAGRTWYH